MEQQIKQLDSQLREHTHNGIDGSSLLPTNVFVTKSLEGTLAQTAANYGIVFVATRPCFVKAVSEVHTVAGNDAGAVTLQIERLQGTTALDSGTVMLATAFDLKGTANTVQRGDLLKGTVLSLQLGDRLALKDSGTLTTLQGVCVTIEIQYQ